MSDHDETSYSGQAAEFIAGVERYAALQLPVLPDDPAAAAAMRTAGYDVLAEVKELDDPIAVVHVLSEDDNLEHIVSAGQLARALEVAPDELVGQEFIATMRETPETGPVLSEFRPVPTPE